MGERRDVVVVPVREHHGRDRLRAEHAHVGQQLLDDAVALAGRREADAAVDDDALSAPVEHRHVPADLAEAADRHDPQFRSHGRTVQERTLCIAAPGPVRYLAGSGCGAAW